MRALQVMKRELRDTTTNKRYMAGFFLQLLLLVLIVPAFSSFLAGGEIRAAPVSMKGFVPLGVVDASKGAPVLLKKLSDNDRLDTIKFDRYPAEELEKGEISAVLTIPREYDEGSAKRLEVLLLIDESNLKEGVVYDAVVRSVRSASEEISEERTTRFNIQVTEPLTIKKELLRPLVMEKEGERFSSFFIAYLLPVMLLFPVFMSGSLVVDSIVGEKERGTLESLLASPAGTKGVVLGKFSGVFVFITSQCVLWLLLLKGTGIPMDNFISVIVMLALLNGAVISLAVFLAIYSTDVKEANLLLMLMYVFLFVTMLTSLTLDFFNPSTFSLLSPFVLISRLLVGAEIGTVAPVLIITLLTSCSALFVLGGVKLLERDDMIFGPRAQTFEIFSDLVEAISLKFENTGVGITVIALASGMIAVFLSIFLEVFLGISVLFFFGYSRIGFTLMILLFALAEEATKPIAVLSIASRKPERLERLRVGLFYGAICGIGFFLMENLVVLSFLVFTFPRLVLRILSLRAGTTFLVHVFSSSIVGAGLTRYSRGKGKEALLYLSIATFLHAAYNLFVLGVVS